MDACSSNDEVLRILKSSEYAVTPTKGSLLSAGFDLYSAYNYEIPPKESCLVSTDLTIGFPAGTYGQLQSRSGLALHHRVVCQAGVIDQDYRGIVRCLLFNFGKETYKVKRGDRVCQLLIVRVSYPIAVEVQSLDLTERGAKGFGSSGIA